MPEVDIEEGKLHQERVEIASETGCCRIAGQLGTRRHCQFSNISRPMEIFIYREQQECSIYSGRP